MIRADHHSAIVHVALPHSGRNGVNVAIIEPVKT
jgi:hypothetical protein